MAGFLFWIQLKTKRPAQPFTDKESALSLSAVVNSAVDLLAEYNLRLSEELEKRRKVAAMLRDFAQAQRDLAKQAEARLEVNVTFVPFLLGLEIALAL